MTAKQMSITQQQRFTRICEDQGIKVTRTKKGLLLRFPDGSSTVQHFTTSDVKATQNQIARFRRAGMTHPEDNRGPKDLPAYITSGSITPATRKKIIDYVLSRGVPEVVYQKDVSKDTGMDPGWANRALFHTGFRPGKAKNSKIGRPWYTPEELLEQRPAGTVVHDPVVGDEPASIPEREATPAEEAAILESVASPASDFVEVGPPTPEPIEDITPEEAAAYHEAIKSQQEAVEREFIDTHESWVVEPGDLFGNKFKQFMKDELRVIEALGLEFEIRVWRKPQ